MCLWLYTVCPWNCPRVMTYSTDLDTLPTVLVEQQGTQSQIVPERKGMEGDLYLWYIAWNSESSWASQVHIEHPFEETISTIVMGRVDDQELFLFNDTTAKTLQWTSTTGGLEQTQALEEWYRYKSCSGLS